MKTTLVLMWMPVRTGRPTASGSKFHIRARRTCSAGQRRRAKARPRTARLVHGLQFRTRIADTGSERLVSRWGGSGVDKRVYGFLAIPAVVGGILGGALTNGALRGGAAWAQSPGAPDLAAGVVKAREFALVDSGGKERGALRVDGDGATRLTLLDPEGKRRISLGVTPRGAAAVILYDAHDESRATVMTRSDGNPVLALFDGAGGIRASLGPGREGAYELKLFDAGGNPIGPAR
jgi:hypothetical protein